MKRWFVLLGGLLLPLSLWGSAKHDLTTLHQEIHQLKKDLSQTKRNRSQVQAQIKQLEESIGRTAKQRYQLQLKEKTLRQSIEQLDHDSQLAQAEGNEHQSNLSLLLNKHYEQSDVLSQTEDIQIPTDLWLDMAYLTALAEDQDKAATESLTKAIKLQRLSAKQQRKAAELKQVETKLAQQTTLLEQQKIQRDRLYTELSKTAQTQQQHLDGLIKNERQLTLLVEELEKQAKRRQKPRKYPKPPADSKSASRPENSVGRNTELPSSEGDNHGQFGKLKGQLHLPLLGELANRFGSPRSDTGLTWHGIFIKALEGQPVKAVASGQVVYADWLRGFGNLIIIDHGDGYMSLYGSAESMLVAVGRQVSMGDTIATSGRSGSNSQSGIYFELRYQSRPFDPMTWVAGR